MESIAAFLQNDLEELGEYVVLANRNWFAIFPNTLLSRIDVARRNDRVGPNLIVYTTNSADPRAHYVIPHSIVLDLLVENTLTTSTVDGTKRWNLTLKKGKLHVSHRPGAVDVSPFRGLGLLAERPEHSVWPLHSEVVQPTASASYETTVPPTSFQDMSALERAVRRMANTARETVAAANGQQTLRTKKYKDLRFDGTALEEHIRTIVHAQQGRCALTDLVLAFDGDSDDSDLLCSLDRINSEGHYEAGNIQVVCRFANRWKAADTDDNFRRLLRLVRAAGGQT